MTSDVIVRPYQAADEEHLVTLWNASMWADPIDALAWRSRYLLDPNFDPNSCIVATSNGAPCGFVLGMTQREATNSDAWIVGFGVSPSHRRQGIGRALFTTLENKWRTSGIDRITIGPYIPSYVTPGVDESSYPEAIAFLEAMGATTLNRPLSMKASLTGYQPASSAVETTARLAAEGVTIRPAVPADILPLLDFLEEHFPHWRGDATGVMLELFGSEPRQVTLHIAEENGTIIGYAQSRAERFGPFGVNESCRGRGIGAALLAHVLPAMRARGFHCAWFLWTSARAAKLYREHGFEEVRRFALMAKSLT
jgi:ribosomal protein S18 acetylase RimI-like enzyme